MGGSQATSPEFREIGLGTFGAVFEVSGTSTAIKKTLIGSAAAWTLLNEFEFGQQIYRAFNFEAPGVYKAQDELKHLTIPQVPLYIKCFHTINADGKHEWWKQNGARFPHEHGYDKAGPVFCFERVPRLPELLRTRIIREYFRPEEVSTALVNDQNQDALVRPYLGCSFQNLTDEQRRHGRSSLRNFPLYIDELEKFGYQPTNIARSIAVALAAAHWCASIDLLDSEFVLGGRPVYSPQLQMFLDSWSVSIHDTAYPSQKTIDTVPIDEPSRRHPAQLWLIDFDKCATFQIKAETRNRDIEELVSRTRTNDPYYPSSIPVTSLEQSVWETFRDTYILASQALLRGKLKSFAGLWESLWTDGLQVSEKKKEKHLNLPIEVMNEWPHQEKRAMHASEFKRRKDLAIKEGRYGASWKPLKTFD